MKKRRKGSGSKFYYLLYAVIGITIGLYLMKSQIFLMLNLVYDGTIRIANLRVNQLDITGASPKVSEMIRHRLRINSNTSILDVSTKEVYNKVISIAWIKEAIIKKHLPNILQIQITETTPIAIYQQDGRSVLIDKDGKFLEEVQTKYRQLPLVSGLNAPSQVAAILNIIKNYPNVYAHLEALTYVRERRWDLTVAGNKVNLPEKLETVALDTLDRLIQSGKLNEASGGQIDLRFAGQIIMNGTKIRNIPGI